MEKLIIERPNLWLRKNPGTVISQFVQDSRLGGVKIDKKKLLQIIEDVTGMGPGGDKVHTVILRYSGSGDIDKDMLREPGNVRRDNVYGFLVELLVNDTALNAIKAAFYS